MVPGKKECIGCYELIHEKAQKCPHCQQIQSKLYTAQYNKWVLVPLLVVLFGFLLYTMNDLRRITSHRGKEKILLVESEQLYSRGTSHGDFISCTGTLANKTVLDATYIDLRADFYNSKKELIDTLAADSNLKIKARTAVPYRVRGETDKPLADYNSCKVTVVD